MFNTFINAILTQWPHTFGANLEKGVENVTGLKAIAGIETLDTNILGGIIISAIITWIHNRYYSKRLPEMLGVFQGLTFVVTISFLCCLSLQLHVSYGQLSKVVLSLYNILLLDQGT